MPADLIDSKGERASHGPQVFTKQSRNPITVVSTLDLPTNFNLKAKIIQLHLVVFL